MCLESHLGTELRCHIQEEAFSKLLALPGPRRLNLQTEDSLLTWGDAEGQLLAPWHQL